MAFKINIPQNVPTETRVVIEELIRIINQQDIKIQALEEKVESL